MMIPRSRAVQPLLLAAAPLLLGACMNVNDAKSTIRQHRVERFDAWRSEGAAKELPLQPLMGGLSIEESILIALGNSRDIQLAVLEREKADARITEAYSQAYPRVDVGASYTRLDDAPGIGGIGGIEAPKNNYDLSATLTQPLYRGGAVGAGVRAAKLYALLVDEQKRSAFQDVVADVRRAYYEAWLSAELVKANNAAVEVARDHLVDVRKNFAAGTASSFDVLRADVELKNLIATQVQSQNRYNVAITVLYDRMGVSQQSTVALTDTLTYEPFDPPMGEAVQLAFMQHPQILQDELSVHLQREAIAVAKSGFWPTLDAFIGESYARPDPHNAFDDSWGDAWRAGITLNYPLFEGFRTTARVRQERLTLQQNEIRLHDTEQRILLGIRQAILSLQDAARFVESQQASVEQAQEALRLAELGFREGIRKEIEVSDARRALTSARANYAQAVYDHHVARLLYERATGTVEPPPVTVNEGPAPAQNAPPPPLTKEVK